MKSDKFAPPSSPPHRLLTAAEIMIVLVAGLLMGFSVQVQLLGEIAICLYALAAFVLQISSRSSFSLALAGFMFMAVLQLTHPDGGGAANFAVYTFLLMAVGTASLLLEVRRQAKWDRWRHESGRQRSGSQK